MTRHHNLLSRKLLGASLLGALALAAAPAAWAQQEQGRVISSTPIRTPDGVAAYSVTYEYAGRQYSTRTDTPPGKFIAVQVTPMGVMTPEPQDLPPAASANAPSAEPWRNVTPESGVVVSGGGIAPAPIPAPTVIYQGAPPVYAAPAPVYVAPAYGYGYGYPAYGYGGYGYGYPPIGVSLNFGYSYSHGYRGYRGWR